MIWRHERGVRGGPGVQWATTAPWAGSCAAFLIPRLPCQEGQAESAHTGTELSESSLDVRLRDRMQPA
jgi:hypothetical protein